MARSVLDMPTSPTSDPQHGASAPAEQLKAQLRRLAARLGLAALGFVPAQYLAQLHRELTRRHACGTYPAFCEQDPDLRADPQRWLEGARSLWVAAWPYEPPRRPTGADARPQPPWGRLAAYAICPDYHHGLRRRLQILVRWAARRTGRDPQRDFRILVDTGPPVERELLRLSGIGYIARNTCAFVPQAGSWVVLGTVVSTLPLPPDPQAPDPDTPPRPPDMCLDCYRCIQACPTGALSSYEMDPSRCISHLTQLRGFLSEEDRLRLGGWVFGCDICQLACPYNSPEHAPLAYFHPRRLRPVPGLSTRMSLQELLRMSPHAFQAGLGRSAAAWRGRNVLQRNAAYAAGHALARRQADDPELVRLLEELAETHPSPVVREACRWALSRPARNRPRPPNPSRTPPSGVPSPPGGGTPAR